MCNIQEIYLAANSANQVGVKHVPLSSGLEGIDIL